MEDANLFPANGEGESARAAFERLRQRVNEHDGQLQGLSHIVANLEQALIIQAHLEKRQSEAIKEHATLIARHHEMLAGHEEFVKFHELKMREFDEKLNAVIEIIMRRESGSET